MPTYTHTQLFPVPVNQLFEYHTRPGALPYLSPPWESTEVIQEAHNLLKGKAIIKIPLGPLSAKWQIEHFDYREGEQFCDRQVKGPFKKWIHTHRFEAISEEESKLIDTIEFEMPLGINITQGIVRKKLDQLFRYRSELITQDLITHVAPKTNKPMRILITGATGFIGRALVPFLRMQGHTVLPVSRKPQQGYLHWDPYKKEIGPEAFENTDAVIHLAGAGVIQGRWTDKRKKAILESRFLTTQFLVDKMLQAKKKPDVFICSSGIGAYGSQIDFTADESSPLGDDFLAYVCKSWEKAAHKAHVGGIRTVSLRTGLVLSPAGGLLKGVLPIFKAALGGPLGRGKQMMSWVAMNDILGLIQFCLANESIEGPVNAVAPEAHTNEDFSKTLAQVLGRPCLFRIPASLIEIILGKQMATETVLSDTHCVPKKALEAGYEFRHPKLEGALKHLCGC